MCFHRTRFRNAAGQSKQVKAGTKQGFYYFSPPSLPVLLPFLSARRGGCGTHKYSTSFIYTKSDYILRRGPVARDRACNMTKRHVCPRQLPHFIVRTDKTYCIHILFNKAAHNRELAFEMAFVCLRAHNMCRGSKSWCFVILQIKTKQFPFECINISGRNPRSGDSTCIWRYVSPRLSGFSKAITRQQQFVVSDVSCRLN